MQQKKFWSETYQRFLSFRVTTSTIRKVKMLAGGIDEYLLRAPNHLLLYKKATQIKRNMRRVHRKRAMAQDVLSSETSSAVATTV